MFSDSPSRFTDWSVAFAMQSPHTGVRSHTFAACLRTPPRNGPPQSWRLRYMTLWCSRTSPKPQARHPRLSRTGPPWSPYTSPNPEMAGNNCYHEIRQRIQARSPEIPPNSTCLKWPSHHQHLMQACVACWDLGRWVFGSALSRSIGGTCHCRMHSHQILLLSRSQALRSHQAGKRCKTPIHHRDEGQNLSEIRQRPFLRRRTLNTSY